MSILKDNLYAQKSANIFRCTDDGFKLFHLSN